ncbi:MAG: hypothetical protein EB117_14150 [Betaproteobacteria bacterium]|nr:hypothetical protein [Betaproteobacteria bacterium]
MTTPDKGTTIRFPATSLFTVDSHDRWDSYTQENNATALTRADPFNFQLPNRGLLQTGAFTRIGVSEVVMPWCPNINPHTDRIGFLWNVGGVPTIATITVPQGFLKPSDIASAIQTQVRALDPTNLGAFTMQYGIGNFPLFSYSSNNATEVAFTPMSTNTFNYSDQTKQLFNILGFTEQNTIPLTSHNGYPTYCQAVRYVDIVCPLLTQYQGVYDSSTAVRARDSLCRVYLPGYVSGLSPSDPDFAPPGTVPTVVYVNYNNPKYIQWVAKQNIGSSSLTFQVYDDQGQLFSSDQAFGPNTTDNWSMTMLVSEN